MSTNQYEQAASRKEIIELHGGARVNETEFNFQMVFFKSCFDRFINDCAL